MAFRRGGASERRGTPADLVVVGLGNPGADYAGTRHNVGADVVALLADRHGGRLKAGKERSLSCEVRIGAHRVALAFPQTFYNDSGLAAAALLHRHGVDDPHPHEVVGVQVGLDRLEAVVAGQAATDLHLELAGGQVHLVVHHHQPVRIVDAVQPEQLDRPGRRSDGAGFTVASFSRYFIHDPLHHLVDVGLAIDDRPAG